MNDYDEQILKGLRKKIFITSHKNGITHIASAFSCLELLYVLYARNVLHIDKTNPQWPDRDRIILSKGHAAIGLYAVMDYVNILAESEMDTFLRPGTRLAGEPCKRDMPWIEASTGSLGHGLSMGVGMALAQKIDHRNARTFVILGDGECQEGAIWEAAMSAAAYKVDNLVAILDHNKYQKMHTVSDTMLCVDWKAKWEAFGWQVTEIDGHDTDAIHEELEKINMSGKPKLVIAHTVKGKGVSLMEANGAKWHYKEPTPKETRRIIEELDVSEEEIR